MKIDPKEVGIPTNIGSGDAALTQILGLVYTWAGIIAVLIIVIAGLFFVTARGNADQVKRSKDAIRGAVIGLVVVMVAFVITQFVIGAIQ